MARKGATYKPTDTIRQQIMEYGCVGLTQAQMATLVDLDEKTLRKYYSKEIALSRVQANAVVGKTLFQKAVEGDTASQIFYLKCRANWKEKTEPQEHNVNIRDWTVKVKK